ncbi:hypothetical protein, partial [Actinoallomurus acaciae]
ADVRAAARAGATDAAAVLRARKGHRPVPDEVWRRLRTSADDPDYTHGLYDRLGPAGTARLIAAAGKDHREDVRISLGVASHHMTLDERWLRAMLDEALHQGVRDEAVELLSQAGLTHRTRVALGHLGLTEMAETAGSGTGHPAPPHEAMLTPAADDPHVAVELYSRHPETLHRALADGPRSEALTRLVIQATTAHDADPAAVRANAERLAAFAAGRSTETPA